MKKKILIALILLVVLSGTVFSQHKYSRFNTLLGFNWTLNATPNIYKTFKFDWPVNNYAFTTSLGLNVDFYLFPWLSLSTGAAFQAGGYLFLTETITNDNIEAKIGGIAKTPLTVTVPVKLHINIPYMNFLYIGGGVNFNIPVHYIKVNDWKIKDSHLTFGQSRAFYMSFPLEFGFDFVKKDKGGGRFIFQATPEIIDGKVIWPVGFQWQFTNIRLGKSKA